LIRSALAARLRRIGHAHSERSDGPAGNASVPSHAVGRAALARAAGGDLGSLVVPHQVHGAHVAVVTAEDCRRTVPATDGLAAADPGLTLLVQGADCPLLLVADDAAGAVCVAHSGWRGTAARIADAALRAVGDLGARREDVVAAVFPGIGPCCFEVGPDVVAAFRETFGPAAAAWTRPGRPDTDRAFLDLGAAIRRTLEEAGVAPERIDVVPGCTVCDGRFFSHRGSRGGAERHGLAATLRAAGAASRL
jgi:polyphenol oxidase